MKNRKVIAVVAAAVVLAMTVTTLSLAGGGTSTVSLKAGPDAMPKLQLVRATTPVPGATATGETPSEVLASVTESFANLDHFTATASIMALVNEGQVATSMTMWFQQPNNLRIELESPVDDVLPEGAVLVTDGNALTAFSPQDNQAIQITSLPQVSVMVQEMNGTFPVLPALNLRALLQGLQNETTITLAGEQEVAGRPTQVIEARPTASNAGFSLARVWADTETNLPVQVTVYDTAGRAAFSFQFTSLDTESSIPAGTFDLSAPEGAEVTTVTPQDMAAQLNLTPATRDEAIEQAGFTLFVPSQLPAGTTDEFIRTSTVDGQTVVGFFYGTGETISTAVVESAQPVIATNLSGTGTATVDGQTAQVGQIGGANFVTWTEGETIITIVSSMSASELLEFANTLQPA